MYNIIRVIMIWVKFMEKRYNIEETIIKIHDYYYNKIMLEHYNDVPADVINSIDSITLMNGHNNITKTKYITLVNDIMSKNMDILDEINEISKLTEMFFEIRDDLNFYSVDILKEMLNKYDGEYKI